MPVNNIEEYDKVVNVSWYAPEKSREELRYVPGEGRLSTFAFAHRLQLSLCSSVLPDVSSMLHRHTKLSQPVLLLL